MGLFDNITQFLNGDAADAVTNAGDTIQNVSDTASQVAQDGAGQVVSEQLEGVTQPVEEATASGQEWVEKLSGNSEEN